MFVRDSKGLFAALLALAIAPAAAAPKAQPVCADEQQSSPVLRRPGEARREQREAVPCVDSPAAARPLPPLIAVPDRWRVLGALGVKEKWWDPYSGYNSLKGDLPYYKDWFFNVLAISDTVIEPRYTPVPVGNAATDAAGSLNLIGRGEQRVESQSLIVELVWLKGDTTFKPPDYEFRITPVINFNRVIADEVGLLRVDPARGKRRSDNHIGWQTAFFDYHIRNVSDRYDFDSVRIGIQPFSSDFRGFLFQDQQLGVRFFGIRDNNRFQYNLAWFRRLEKDTNSGLNDLEASVRDDDVFIANLYHQDWPWLGYFSQWTAVYNRNREGNEAAFFDANGFIQRPASLGLERSREYDAYYFGYNADGHIGRLNITLAAYAAFGEESNSVFSHQASDIEASFFALELSRDYSWIRPKFSMLFGSGDDNPFDDKSKGFDAIFENPQFAGGDTSFLIRQGLPLIGGGRVALSGRNGILNSLRSSKEQGQSNFVNPGVQLIGLGVDLDLTPTFRLSFQANQIWFHETATLETARNQAGIDRDLGLDLSMAMTWRPFMTQNIVARLSGAILQPGAGYRDLYGNDQPPYSVLANLVLQY